MEIWLMSMDVRSPVLSIGIGPLGSVEDLSREG